jgi:chromosome segregation ATPase
MTSNPMAPAPEEQRIENIRRTIEDTKKARDAMPSTQDPADHLLYSAYSATVTIGETLLSELDRREQEHQEEIEELRKDIQQYGGYRDERADGEEKIAHLEVLTEAQKTHFDKREASRAEEIRKARDQGYKEGWMHRDTCSSKEYCPDPSHRAPSPPTQEAA